MLSVTTERCDYICESCWESSESSLHAELFFGRLLNVCVDNAHFFLGQGPLHVPILQAVTVAHSLRPRRVKKEKETVKIEKDHLKSTFHPKMHHYLLYQMTDLMAKITKSEPYTSFVMNRQKCKPLLTVVPLQRAVQH